MKRKEAMKEPRLPFDATEIAHIFEKSLEAKDTLLASTIAIAAYTGMRAEEIAQIRKADIQEPEKSKYIINVRDVGTKTKAGIRAVPVHDDLYPLIKFLVKDSKSEYLLDYQTLSRIDKRSVLLVTRFSKLKRNLNYGKEKTFHSLRHSLATQLERAEIAENIAADILGHKKTTMSYGLYSGGTSIAARLEAISKIEGFQLLINKIVPKRYFESA
ncbi:Phage integrase family protein [compost metagenome]